MNGIKDNTYGKVCRFNLFPSHEVAIDTKPNSLDMVETEERKMKEREEATREQQERDAKAGKVRHKRHKNHEQKKNATHDQEGTNENHSSK